MNITLWKKTPIRHIAPSLTANAHVLVIDDEESIREWLMRGLPIRGYRVEAASNATEALERIGHQKFDLIVCDIRMPGQGGMELLKDIKRLQPDIEVIMATGYATVDTAVESIKLGAYDYIAKPFDLDHLCAILEAALAIRQSRKAAIRLQNKKSYLRWLWLLPLGIFVLQGVNLAWQTVAPTDLTVQVPPLPRPQRRIVVKKTVDSMPQKRKESPLIQKQSPPLFLHSELIPPDVDIVQWYYSYPIVAPGGALDFNINGTGFSREFEQTLNVKSGTPEVWMHDLQWVTANQIHGHLKATPNAVTGYWKPYVYIHEQAVFQADSPFAVIRPGDVLDILLVNADETGRSGKFRVYANLNAAMEKEFRLVPDTPELELSTPRAIAPFVWEGLVRLKKITAGEYGLTAYIGKHEVYQNKALIQVVKPNISKMGFAQRLSALERHRRPGDRVTLYLLGSGFVPKDITLFKAHVKEWNMGEATFKYVSPGRLSFSFTIPPQAAEAAYGVTVDKGDQPFYQQSNLFTVVPSNWLDQVDVAPLLSPGHHSELRVKGRDFTPYFVQRMTIEIAKGTGLHISGLHQIDADNLAADIQADPSVPPGDYVLHIAAQGQPVNGSQEQFIVKVMAN
jgi:CheY-like chemotaxis protein